MSIRAILVLFVLGSRTLAEQPSVERARKLVGNGSTGGAIQMLRRVIAAEPGNADAHLLLGTTLALQGNRSESLQQLREAVRLRPDSAEAYRALGMALGRFVEIKAAREAFERAIELNPNVADAHADLSLILAQSGEWRLAREHLNRAIQIEGNKPPAARFYYLRAGIAGEQNDLGAARADLERAVLLRPDFAVAWARLGAIRRALLDDAGSLSAFQRAVEIDPKDAKAQYWLGSEYLRSGQADPAIKHLRESLAFDPDNRAALYNLQLALRRAGRSAEAEEVEAKMAELLRRRARASEAAIKAVKLNNEAVELEKGGNLPAAVEKYRTALDLDPDHGGFRLNLGLALCRLNRWEEGIAEIREVLRRDPNNAAATRALYIAMEEQSKNAVPAGSARHPGR